MSEIEKMYENVGIEPEYVEGKNLMEYSYGTLKYPLFTAEKQIELIKLLAKNDNIYITFYPPDNTYNIRYCVAGFYDGSIIGDKEVTNVDFEEALAGIINVIWQSLTPEEKQQVKGILE